MSNTERIAFENAENKGRNKALSALKKVCLFKDGFDDYNIVPTDGFCNWDFEVIDNKDNSLLAVIEAKDRRYKSTDIAILTEGTQLEESKYNRLKNIADKRNIYSFYISTYADNRFNIWDVSRARVTEDYRHCNKTTAVLTEKIAKHCYYFQSDDADVSGEC